MVSDRREHLKQYLRACVRDSALSWGDLASNPDKFMRLLSRDTTAVLKELGREGGVGLLRIGAALLASVAEKAVAGNKRR